MIEFKSVEKPDETKRRCYDCLYLKGAISLWCTNSEAQIHRITSIPGISGCNFWEPMKWRYDPKHGFWKRLWINI